jgi:thioredoxin-like negative regulator of GroEL
MRDGQPQSVVDVLGPVWERVPANAPLAERLGTALVMVGQFDAALPILEGVLDRTSGNQDVLVAAIAAQVESAVGAGRPLAPAERARLLAWANRLDDSHRPAAEQYLSIVR